MVAPPPQSEAQPERPQAAGRRRGPGVLLGSGRGDLWRVGTERLRKIPTDPPDRPPAPAGQRDDPGLWPGCGAPADAGAAPDQPGIGGGQLLQEAVADGKPGARGPPVRVGG